MPEDDLIARLKQAEAEIAALRARLDQAEGEAMFAGMLAGPLMVVAVKRGLISADAGREMLDRTQLRFQERAGAAPQSARAIEHAVSRLEATLRQCVPPLPPEPR